MSYSFFKLSLLTVLLSVIFILSNVSVFAQEDYRTPKFGIFYPPTITNTPTPTPTLTPTATPFPTAIWTGPSPTPTPSNAQLVIQLVNAIRRNCRPDGYVSNRNYPCLNNLAPPLPSNVLEELQISAIGIGWLQCVGFVRAAVSLTTGITLDRVGNAIAYASQVPSFYRFIRNAPSASLLVEDIPIWDYADSVGHMAYVVEVYDSRNFRVAEANFGYRYSGKVNLRRTTIDSPELIGWLRKR